MMYYLIETRYVGPNADQDRYVDADKIEVSTEPARTNQSGEVCLDGWCGTTNDWAVYAHGEYASEEEARAAISEKIGPVRENDSKGEPFESLDESVIAVFRPGQYAPLSAEQTGMWVYDDIQQSITASSSDEAIESLANELEAAGRQDGFQIDRRAVIEAAESARKEARQALEDA